MRKNISMYRASQYNTLIPLRSDLTLAYNGVSGAMAVWEGADREIYDLVLKGGVGNEEALSITGNDRYLSTILGDLEKGMFVINEHHDEQKLVNQIVNIARYNGARATFTIAPTLACNFGCDYCYQNDESRSGMMDEEIRRKTIAFVKKRTQGRRALNVAWYGGEPLLAADLVVSMSDELTEYCRENNIAWDGLIVTNGYYLTREMTERLSAAKVTYAQVTIDGDRATHDTRRILKGGGGTFDRILNNISESVLVDGFSITVRVNVDRRNKNGIVGLLHALREAGLAGRENFRVYFAPVDICSQECLRIVDKVMNLEDYAAIEAHLIRTAVDMGLACVSLPTQLFSLCAAVKPNGFVVLPNGDVHKCWHTVSNPADKICSLNNADFVEEMPLYEEWTSGSLFVAPECDTCGILPNCTGGCAHKARSGLSSSCVSLKHNIRERLTLYALSKGAITEDNLPERRGSA